MTGAGPHRYFHTAELPPLLARVAAAEPPSALADLGAADGSMLYALDRAGLLGERAYAVDLSPERVAVCRGISPRIEGIVADATHVEALADGSLDAVVASQLVEHLPDDTALAREAARLLRPGGWLYASSVVRGRRAWWIYRADGRWATDPTHLREYPSEEAFAAALAHPALVLLEVRSQPLAFPLSDLVLRALAFARVLPFERLPFAYRRVPERLRRLRVRVPGYRFVEAALHRLPPP